MPRWFDEVFGGSVEDVRSKLVDESWFGRRSAFPHNTGDLGWTRGDQPEPSNSHSPEIVHGIER